jgi:preprotein translocase subunit Sss1
MTAPPRAAGVGEVPRWQRAIVPLACVALSILQWFPIFEVRGSTGFGDWQMIQHNWEAAYISLARFGQWPLWDPFHCGGISIFRNPESQVYSPFFPLSFAVGTVWAVKIMLVTHVALGLWGAYKLARERYALHWLASAVAAFAWGCSGCIVWDGAGGHATFLPFSFTPWLIWLVRSAAPLRRKAAWIALLFVLTLYEGGTYPLPFFVLLLGFELVLLALRDSRKPQWPAFRDALALGALSLALTALAGTLRIVPSVLALREFPRQMPNEDAVDLLEVLIMLTARDHPWRTPAHRFVWAEYGSYMGWPLVILGGVGLVIAIIRGPRDLLAGLVGFGSIMLGNLGAYAPWSLLHELPVFDSLRVPTRFAMFFTLYLALLGAVAIDAAVSATRGLRTERMRFLPVAALALLTLLAAAQLTDVIAVSRPTVRLWRGDPLDDSPPADHHYLVGGRYGQRYASYPRLNLGTPQCYAGAMNWVVSRALWTGDKPQVRLQQAEGTVYEVRHTPSRWSADIDLKTAGRVWFNQNFADGWQANVGSIVNDQNLLAVDLPAGRQAIELRYAPHELAWCVLLSALGLAAIGLVGFWRLRL